MIKNKNNLSRVPIVTLPKSSLQKTCSINIQEEKKSVRRLLFFSSAYLCARLCARQDKFSPNSIFNSNHMQYYDDVQTTQQDQNVTTEGVNGAPTADEEEGETGEGSERQGSES